MQKGFSVGWVLLGVAVVGAGLFLIKDSLPFLRIQYSVRSVTLPVRTMFLTNGSEEYCQQFDLENCPRKYCDLSGSSCPVCMNIGSCHAKEFPKTPFPTPNTSLAPTGVDEAVCNSDSECGVNTCGCTAVRKEFLTKNMCAQACIGEPKCLNNKCVLVTGNTQESFCGGYAGETGQYACPSGYKCQYPEPVYPDAQGKCVKL